jgi:hypothetical protein
VVLLLPGERSHARTCSRRGTRGLVARRVAKICQRVEDPVCANPFRVGMAANFAVRLSFREEVDDWLRFRDLGEQAAELRARIESEYSL